MQAALRHSEWDEVDLRYDGGTIALVYRRTRGSCRFEPWVYVAPSAILRRLGAHGLGLYAARPFKRNDYVGQYPHDAVVGRYPTREAAREAPETRRLLMRGHDKLVTVRAPNGPGFLLLDGEGGGPPHVERANDPRGTALAPNAALTDTGWLRITQARVPRFDLEKPLDENIYSELRYDYGDSYWDLHELLGRSAAHALEVD
jgi:hypothetical protein